MNAALPKRAAEQLDTRSGDQRRLAVASRLAAGMLANPKTYEMVGWETQVPTFAARVADKLISLCDAGGL